MKANRMWLFSDVLEKNKRVFRVPVYQRNYDWTNIQCEKLFLDILEANKKNCQHFIGTVVYIDDVNGGSGVNVNIRMYNFDDVQCTVIPPVAYGFVTGMNLQLC